MPSRIAIDRYREALANPRAWGRDLGKRKMPRVRKSSIMLHPGQSYRIRDEHVGITTESLAFQGGDGDL